MDINTQLEANGFDGLLEQCKREVMEKMAEVGEQYVADAVNEGNYHNVTGHLRASNYYEVHTDGLELGNKADYASNVEARGLEVSSTFALRAEAKLREIFE